MSNTTNTADISDSSLIYDTVDVSKALLLQESTIRKYCALLKKHGYEFQKNSAGHRIFYDSDIAVLRKMVHFKNVDGKTLEESAKLAISGDTVDISNVSDISVTSDTALYNNLLTEFSTFKESQEEFNRQLLQQLEKQQEYIVNRLEERDKALMLSLKETLEVKRQIAEKKKWWKFWRT